MQYFTEKLTTSLSQDATLTGYVMDNSSEIDSQRLRPAVIVCPGGGYRFTSDREAEPIALKMNSFGCQSFVLRYSCAPAQYPTALFELATAVKLVRQRAAEFHVDPQKIVVLGFSAGGHLAANLATKWDQPELTEAGFVPAEIKPNALALGYPVITSDAFAHEDSINALLGEKASEGSLNQVSLEKQVTEQTPPAFIWTTDDDATVPVENSLLYVRALKKVGISCELHIFAHGVHGMSLATKETATLGRPEQISGSVAVWPELFAHWLEEIFKRN